MTRDEKATRADRGLRDEANVGPDPRGARQLTPMRELDHFEVASGEPDIRGWRVFTSAGRELGQVEDLLVDTEAREVVMLDIDLRRDDRHTLAPIRAAWIDREHERVIIDSSELDEETSAAPTTSRDREPVIVVREPRASDREVRREVDSATVPADRQVRYPASLTEPRDASSAPRGRVIEEVVVRRREVGPDEEVGR